MDDMKPERPLTIVQLDLGWNVRTNQYKHEWDFEVASFNRYKLLVKSASQAIMIGLVFHDFGHQRDAKKTPQEMDSDARQSASESLIEDFWWLG